MITSWRVVPQASRSPPAVAAASCPLVVMRWTAPRSETPAPAAKSRLGRREARPPGTRPAQHACCTLGLRSSCSAHLGHRGGSCHKEGSPLYATWGCCGPREGCTQHPRPPPLAPKTPPKVPLVVLWAKEGSTSYIQAAHGQPVCGLEVPSNQGVCPGNEQQIAQAAAPAADADAYCCHFSRPLPALPALPVSWAAETRIRRPARRAASPGPPPCGCPVRLQSLPAAAAANWQAGRAWAVPPTVASGPTPRGLHTTSVM